MQRGFRHGLLRTETEGVNVPGAISGRGLDIKRPKTAMAIKKSDLYSSLWASCDALRGGMDASQYKDYVLFMLFIKYVTDKYGNSDDFAPPVDDSRGRELHGHAWSCAAGATWATGSTRRSSPRWCRANYAPGALSDFPDFNDPSNRLGEGNEMVERLTNLINIFASPASRLFPEPRRASTTFWATPTNT